jgi:hypothetical protein
MSLSRWYVRGLGIVMEVVWIACVCKILQIMIKIQVGTWRFLRLQHWRSGPGSVDSINANHCCRSGSIPCDLEVALASGSRPHPTGMHATVPVYGALDEQKSQNAALVWCSLGCCSRICTGAIKCWPTKYIMEVSAQCVLLFLSVGTVTVKPWNCS